MRAGLDCAKFRLTKLAMCQGLETTCGSESFDAIDEPALTVLTKVLCDEGSNLASPFS